MIPVLDPFMAGVKPQGLQKGRGGFLRSADDAPYVSDPTGATVKTGARKGEVCRVKYGSPSNRGREIENDAGLVKYKQRLSLAGIGMDPTLAERCRELAELPVGSPEFNTMADGIVVAADRLTRSELAADRGTHGHLLCEVHDEGTLKDRWDSVWPLGDAVGLSIVRQTDTIMAWHWMLADNGLEILAIEASCVDDKWRLAGTLDRIVRTTKPLTFAKPTGELVTIPTNTVLILDIKFGKCRKAHPIQIASYAQSVPYDTETEQRGEWPWPIDQTHALIAHGDFGDDVRPPSIELVWVDLVAGREHGGQCVVDAKAWAARDDVFSVAQIVEEGRLVGTATVTPAPSTLPPVPQSPVAGEGAVVSSGATPSPACSLCLGTGYKTASQYVQSDDDDPTCPCSRPSPALLDPTVNDLLPRQGMPQHALDEIEVDRLNDARRQSYEGWGTKHAPQRYEDDGVTPVIDGDYERAVGDDPMVEVRLTPDPARLALVDARAALCPSPDEGADWSSDEFAPLWDELRDLFDGLDPFAKQWRSELAGQAKRRGVDFMAQGGRTERRYYINKAVVALGFASNVQDDNDDILRELLAHIIGDVALMLGVEPGHALGSLGAAEAARFAAHVDAYLSPLPVA